MDIYNEIQQKNEELRNAVASLSQTGRNYAEAYKTYRILLAQELLRLKNDGMAVTIAYDIARGNEDVANAKFGELSTEAIYRANLENIQAIKLQIKILQKQYDKEWGMAGGMYE